MNADRHFFSYLASGGLILSTLFLLSASICAQNSSSSSAPAASSPGARYERVEISFSGPQLLELELNQYLTSKVRRRRTFEVSATVIEPLKTEQGLVIVPAQTRIRLKAAVRPGKHFGHPGEIILWIDPFLVGKGIGGFQCEPSAENPPARILPNLCQGVWRLSFDHQLDHAATPEAGRPIVLDRKKDHEGITGTRSSGPPNIFYDPSGGNADLRVQTAVNRFQTAGIVYEIGAAFTSGVRFLFSKRNVFLPTGTRVIFQMENKLRLVPATDTEVNVIQFDPVARKRKAKASDDAEEPEKE
jgi:hypothetical protein